MIRAAAHLVTAAAVVFTAAAGVRLAAAQPPTPVRLLDVPYLPQTVALCGGAAAAMVMRYWGATGVYAETFADLVVPAEGGIRGADLLQALRARGWDARSFRGDTALARRQIEARRPLVALIEDRPGTFHYVVLVGWTDGRVIAHDPARAPFRVLDEAAFLAAWSRSGYWSMLALPPPEGAASPAAEAVETAPDARREPCDDMVDQGVRLAVSGDDEAGRRIFETAAAACPASSAPWRELAGLHVLRQEWRQAADAARLAVQRHPGDDHAWRILATSAFLDGEPDDALDAWNAIGEPAIDLVNIRGLDRTRFSVALGAAGLRPGTVLRAEALARARRRLGAIPSVQAARVSYRPAEGGRAIVDAAVMERPVLPTGAVPLMAAGVRAASGRQIRVDVASPSGGGELWTASWRWWQARPGLALGFSAPTPGGAVGRVSLFSETESFAGSGAERRAGGIASLSDWTAGGARWEAGVGAERWRDGARAVLVTASLAHRLAGDRLEFGVRLDGRAGDIRTGSVTLDGAWRSSTASEGPVWLARLGVETLGGDAPLSLWPGAGTGQAREPLLRAHPLLHDGIVSHGVFGRTLAHGGVEWRHWRPAGKGLVRVGPAVFADAARAYRTRAPFDARAHLDIGAGVRVALPGAGVVRFDVARGLRDGSNAFSIGWAR